MQDLLWLGGKRLPFRPVLSQKADSVGNQPVPVCVLTHAAKAKDLEAALAEIKASGVIGGEPVSLRIL